MAEIPDAEITLEICPTSNLLTKALPDEKAVRDTFRAFVAAGVPFTIATDGPEMMRTHLRDEFELLLRIGALSERELAQANAQGHDVSFVQADAAPASDSNWRLMTSLRPCDECFKARTRRDRSCKSQNQRA
jgi:adenosine deaminase